jgi:hypothetical protein
MDDERRGQTAPRGHGDRDVNHGRTIWLAALAALLVLGTSACGDDDSGGGDDDDSAGSGSAGHPAGGDGDKDSGAPSGGSGTGSSSDKDSGTPAAGEGGSGGDVLVDAGSSDGGGLELCGGETCGSPMCCADAFQSLCGLRVNARACLPPQPTSTESDERCPSVSINNGAFMIPSCCTEEMKCGINAQAAGMGCISLEEVIAYTSGMGGGDGGMAPMGMGMGFGIMWPEPKACN